jgi:hypothetical protein
MLLKPYSLKKLLATLKNVLHRTVSVGDDLPLPPLPPEPPLPPLPSLSRLIA